MISLKTLATTLALCGAPVLAVAHGHESSPPPCGLSAGGLSDPAETRRCLAERYKPPKPNTAPRTVQITPPPPADPQPTN